jgi:flagella basal body P-ring formation protein FlgA
MTSSASLAVALGLAAGTAAAAAPGATLPAALAERVAARIAAEWGVPAPAVALEWGLVPEGVPAATEATFRLAGRGTDGRWAVVFGLDGRTTAVRLRAGVVGDVPVAARTLTAGSRLAAADIAVARRCRWGPPRPMSEGTPGPGWLVRRALAAGEPLEPPAVTAPPWAVAGQPLTMTWNRGGVSVSRLGTALHAAGASEPVRARVAGGARPVAGRMAAPGVAVIERGGQP